MAGEEDVKNMLLRLGIDKGAYADALEELDELNEASHAKEKARQVDVANALRAQLQDQLNAISNITDAKQRATAESRAIQDAADTAEIEMIKEKMRQQEHLNELRKEAAKQFEAEKGGGDEGILSKLGEGIPGFISNLTGSSGLGGLLTAGGAFAGIDAGIHLLIEGFEELGSKIKEMVMTIGPLQNQLNTLDHLLAGSGTSAQEFVGELSEATHDLVGFSDLLNFANRTLLQNTGLSKDQIKDLVSTVTDYSRSIGKDAVGSLNELSRALTTGRLSMLAYRLELDPAIKDELNMTSSMEKHARIALETSIVQQAMNDSLARTGPPIWTITDAITSLYNRFVSFEDIMGKNIAQSSAFNLSLEVVYNTATLVAQIFEQLVAVLAGPVALFGELFKILTGFTVGTVVLEIIARIADGIAVVSYGLSKNAAALTLIKEILTIGWEKAWANFKDAGVKALDELEASHNRVLAILNKPDKSTEPGKPAPVGPSAKFLQEMAKLETDLAKETAQAELEIEKEKITRIKDLNDERYKHGEMSLQSYVEAQKKAAEDEYAAEVAKTTKIKNLQIKELEDKAHPEKFIGAAHAARGSTLGFAGTEGGEATAGAAENASEEAKKLNAQIALLNEKADLETLKRKEQLTKELEKYNKMIVEDAIAAEKTREEAAAAIGTSDRKRIQDDAEFELKMGKITGEQLTSIRKDLSIQQEAADVEAANRKFKYSPDSDKAQAEREAAIAKAHRDRVDRDAALDRQAAEDHKSAVEVQAKAEQALLEGRQKALQDFYEWEYKQGIINAEAILKYREQRIEEEKDHAIAAANLTFENAEDKEKARAELDAAVAKAEDEAQTKRATLNRSKDETIFDERKKRYQEQISVIQAQAAVPGGKVSESEAQQRIISLGREHLDQLQHEHSLHSDNILLYQQEEIEIAKVQKEIAEMTEKLNESNKVVASMTSTVAGLLNRFSVTKGFGNIFGDVSSVFSSLDEWNKTSTKIFGENAPSGGVFGGIKKTIGEIISPSDDQQTASERMSDFADALKDGVSAVGGFITAITSAKTTAQGILGGGMAGAGIGANFGPIGAAVGAGVGALMGGIFGHWKEELQKVSTNFTNALKDIADSIQNNTMSLATGIQQAQQQRTDLISQLSGMKGGRSQLQQMLPQINQQIDAMMAQQKQEVQSFMEDYQKLTAPLAYQPIIGSLDTILQKFKEYSSALGTATDAQNTLQQAQQQMAEQNQIASVMGNAYRSTYDYQLAVENLTKAQNGLSAATQHQADAQDYLNAAVQQYVQQQQLQLNQAEEQAVQNAIDLNNALAQRANLLRQTAQEEYNVLAQGSLTREMTVAQTKMQQLDAIKRDRDQQLQQMNAQIQVEQFRVNSETTIFHLATTRVGLEAQLVALQEGQITAQTAQLVALKNVVDSLSSGNPQALLQVLQQLGYNTSQLPTALQQAFQTQVNQNATMGLGGFYGTST